MQPAIERTSKLSQLLDVKVQDLSGWSAGKFAFVWDQATGKYEVSTIDPSQLLSASNITTTGEAGKVVKVGDDGFLQLKKLLVAQDGISGGRAGLTVTDGGDDNYAVLAFSSRGTEANGFNDGYINLTMDVEEGFSVQAFSGGMTTELLLGATEFEVHNDTQWLRLNATTGVTVSDPAGLDDSEIVNVRYLDSQASVTGAANKIVKADGAGVVNLRRLIVTGNTDDSYSDGLFTVVGSAVRIGDTAGDANNTYMIVDDGGQAITSNATSWTHQGQLNVVGTIQENGTSLSAKYAGLDINGKVNTSQLPAFVLGALHYVGVWNASTNTPNIGTAASAGTGAFYKVSAAGTTNKDGITDWQPGDWIVSNGTAWDKIDNTEQVSTVFGRTGNITATAADIGSGTFPGNYTITGTTTLSGLLTANAGLTVTGGTLAAAAITGTSATFSTDGGVQVSKALKVANAASFTGYLYLGARGGGQNGFYVDTTLDPSIPTFNMDPNGRFYLNPSRLSALDVSTTDGTIVVGGRPSVPVIIARANATSTYLFRGQASGGSDVFTVDPAGAPTFAGLQTFTALSSTSTARTAFKITQSLSNTTDATRLGRAIFSLGSFNGDINAVQFDTDGTKTTAVFNGTIGATNGYVDTSNRMSFTGDGLLAKSSYVINWTNGSAYFSTQDVGLARAAAGILKVTDGGSGNGGLTVAAPAAGDSSTRVPTTAWVNSQKNIANGIAALDANGDLVGHLIPMKGTASGLATTVPEDGEFAYATDTKQLKIGDGSTTVANLPGIGGNAVVVNLTPSNGSTTTVNVVQDTLIYLTNGSGGAGGSLLVNTTVQGVRVTIVIDNLSGGDQFAIVFNNDDANIAPDDEGPLPYVSSTLGFHVLNNQIGEFEVIATPKLNGSGGLTFAMLSRNNVETHEV